MPPDDRRIEASPDRRIGNPRPVGRVLQTVPASGSGVVADVRTRIMFGPRPPGDDTLDPPPFFPLSIVDDGGQYKVTIQPGTAGAWNPVTGQDTFALEVPTINGTPVTTIPRPELTVPIGEWVSMRIETDEFNQIAAVPTIQVGDSEGVHYIPEVGDTDPVDGQYHIKLFKLVMDNGSVIVEPGHTSDIDLTPYLWPGINKGGGTGRVLWKYDATSGEYYFRTLEAGYGVEIRENGELIEPWFLAENVGGGAEVYKTPEGPAQFDPAIFKTIIAAYESQLRVTGTEENVEISGNGKSGSIAFLSCDGSAAGAIEWVDGLITSSGPLTVQLGDCSGESSTSAPGP